LSDSKKIYGLIGYPLSHSFSKKYFSEKFEREGITHTCSYQNFELKNINDFPELIKLNPHLVGLNVTIPYKEQIIPLLNELAPVARDIGAVNTIVIRRNFEGDEINCCGHNTDVTGFYSTLKPLLQKHHAGVLVLGTGGASKAIVHALKMLHLPHKSVSRSKSKEAILYSRIDAEILAKFPVIINTTPLGTFPDIHHAPDVPYELLGPHNFLYDLVYNPEETLFLKKGKIQGAQTINGYAMLVAQAEASWKIWNEKSPQQAVSSR